MIYSHQSLECSGNIILQKQKKRGTNSTTEVAFMALCTFPRQQQTTQNSKLIIAEIQSKAVSSHVIHDQPCDSSGTSRNDIVTTWPGNWMRRRRSSGMQCTNTVSWVNQRVWNMLKKLKSIVDFFVFSITEVMRIN